MEYLRGCYRLAALSLIALFCSTTRLDAQPPARQAFQAALDIGTDHGRGDRSPALLSSRPSALSPGARPLAFESGGRRLQPERQGQSPAAPQGSGLRRPTGPL